MLIRTNKVVAITVLNVFDVFTPVIYLYDSKYVIT